MPTIHQNELTMKSQTSPDTILRKLQDKVLSVFEAWKEPKMVEEWSLYMTKSEIVANRTAEVTEL